MAEKNSEIESRDGRVCYVCEKRLSRKQRLDSHLLVIHNIDRKYQMNDFQLYSLAGV